MQRRIEDGIVIACDFCGTDWDEKLPMIEGHRGSVLCLACLTKALNATVVNQEELKCTLCLRDLPVNMPRWQHPASPHRANAGATVCHDCLQQAAKAFADDTDVDSS